MITQKRSFEESELVELNYEIPQSHRNISDQNRRKQIEEYYDAIALHKRQKTSKAAESRRETAKEPGQKAAAAAIARQEEAEAIEAYWKNLYYPFRMDENSHTPEKPEELESSDEEMTDDALSPSSVTKMKKLLKKNFASLRTEPGDYKTTNDLTKELEKLTFEGRLITPSNNTPGNLSLELEKIKIQRSTSAATEGTEDLDYDTDSDNEGPRTRDPHDDIYGSSPSNHTQSYLTTSETDGWSATHLGGTLTLPTNAE